LVQIQSDNINQMIIISELQCKPLNVMTDNVIIDKNEGRLTFDAPKILMLTVFWHRQILKPTC